MNEGEKRLSADEGDERRSEKAEERGICFLVFICVIYFICG
jgi:hypothetical protein